MFSVVAAVKTMLGSILWFYHNVNLLMPKRYVLTQKTGLFQIIACFYFDFTKLYNIFFRMYFRKTVLDAKFSNAVHLLQLFKVFK